MTQAHASSHRRCLHSDCYQAVQYACATVSLDVKSHTTKAESFSRKLSVIQLHTHSLISRLGNSPSTTVVWSDQLCEEQHMAQALYDAPTERSTKVERRAQVRRFEHSK